VYAKSEVQFEHPAKGKNHCSQCVHFLGNGKCEIVSGLIRPEDWCDKWKGTNVAKKHWIQKAIPKEREGVFADKAARAGKTTAEYAEEKKDAGGELGHEANLAQTLMRMNKKKKKG
jgi:hypothetical protein